MTTREQRAAELCAARRLLRELGLRSRPRLQRPPAPDIAFELPDGTPVGLEVVEATEEYIARARPSLIRLEDEVRDELERRGLRASLHLRLFGGAPDLLRRPGVRRKVAHNLADLVDSQRQADVLQRSYHGNALRGAGVEFVRSLRVDLAGEKSLVSTGHLVARYGVGAVQKLIDQKQEKLSKYRAALPSASIWLLMVAGTKFENSIATPGVRESVFATGFDRVYLLDRTAEGWAVSRLRTAVPGGG